METKFYDLEINREYKASPAAVFEAWANLEAKAKWFVGPSQWMETARTLDFREGGTETMTGQFPDSFTTDYRAEYYDIQPNERIGYSFDVRLAGELYSISLAVVEFKAIGGGTSMTYHEQLALYSGQTVEESLPNRITGTNTHFDRLKGYLEL